MANKKYRSAGILRLTHTAAILTFITLSIIVLDDLSRGGFEAIEFLQAILVAAFWVVLIYILRLVVYWIIDGFKQDHDVS
jgi:hypothetical protein